jgi:hypothetical protein
MMMGTELRPGNRSDCKLPLTLPRGVLHIVALSQEALARLTYEQVLESTR